MVKNINIIHLPVFSLGLSPILPNIFIAVTGWSTAYFKSFLSKNLKNKAGYIFLFNTK